MTRNLRTALLWSAFCLAGTAVGAQESHAVQANQTLYSIARLYNVSVDQLRTWNGLDNSPIRVGQTLVVKPATGNAKVNPGLNPFLYTVRTGDSLSALSVKFNTAVDLLRRINGLDPTQGLYVGQRIYIRRPVGISFYTVQSGDTLGQVSAVFDIATADLRSINQLTSETLTPGRVLRVFKPAERPLNHTVAGSDSLAGIAALYGMTTAELVAINGAAVQNLQVGQVLKLRTYTSAATTVVAPAPVQQKLKDPVVFPEAEAPAGTYLVKKGDTLLKISRESGVRLDQLLAQNGLGPDSVLRVGQTLTLGGAEATPVALVSLPRAQAPVTFPAEPAAAPPALPAFRDEDQAKIRWDRYVVLDKSIPVFEWNNDYYYWTHPGEVSQPNRGYYENSWPSPLDAYQKARQLVGKFDGLISEKTPLSSILQGYTIVLDPGHGGIDPGAIVKTVNASGKEAYLTEHEYVYDIALRVYALLKRHGAAVQLTVVAPNHLIRETEAEEHTLVNEKNVVYNDRALNLADDADSWPNGNAKGLEKRVLVADRFFRSATPGKRVFLSLHADNNPTSPLGTGVYALETKEGGTDQRSLAFAQKLVPYLGQDSYTRTQNLAVLRGNDADYKVLVEVHNLASEEQSQAMRAGSSRQLSAQKIVRGLLEAFRN